MACTCFKYGRDEQDSRKVSVFVQDLVSVAYIYEVPVPVVYCSNAKVIKIIPSILWRGMNSCFMGDPEVQHKTSPRHTETFGYIVEIPEYNDTSSPQMAKVKIVAYANMLKPWNTPSTGEKFFNLNTSEKGQILTQTHTAVYFSSGSTLLCHFVGFPSH